MERLILSTNMKDLLINITVCIGGIAIIIAIISTYSKKNNE